MRRRCCRGFSGSGPRRRRGPTGRPPSSPTSAASRATDYSVSLIWRVHVPDEGQRLWPRPSDHEAVDVAITRCASGALNDDEAIVHRLAPDGATVELTRSADLRPGDQVVLAADRGLLDPFGWDPTASEPVVDASLPEQGLPFDGTAIRATVWRRCDTATGDRARPSMRRTRSISPSATTPWKRSWLRSSPPNRRQGWRRRGVGRIHPRAASHG